MSRCCTPLRYSLCQGTDPLQRSHRARAPANHSNIDITFRFPCSSTFRPSLVASRLICWVIYEQQRLRIRSTTCYDSACLDSLDSRSSSIVLHVLRLSSAKLRRHERPRQVCWSARRAFAGTDTDSSRVERLRSCARVDRFPRRRFARSVTRRESC